MPASKYRAAHGTAMKATWNNDTSAPATALSIVEGSRNGGSPVRTTGRLDSYGAGKLPAA